MTELFTDNYDLPFPDLSEPADVPADVAALANKVDDVLKAIEDGYVPIGSIQMFGGSAAPPRWALCNGALVDQVGVYAPLYAVIGNTYDYGHSTVAGKFHLPDFRSRVPLAPDAGAGQITSDNVLGRIQGEALHNLVTFEMPGHTHGDGTLGAAAVQPWTAGWNAPISDTSWTEAQVTIMGASNMDDVPVAGNPLVPDANIGYTPGTHGHDVTGSTGSTGGGVPHNNLQPYLVVNFIIRYQ